MPFLSSLPSGMISLLEWWTSELLHWVWKCEFGNDWFMYVHTSISYLCCSNISTFFILEMFSDQHSCKKVIKYRVNRNVTDRPTAVFIEAVRRPTSQKITVSGLEKSQMGCENVQRTEKYYTLSGGIPKHSPYLETALVEWVCGACLCGRCDTQKWRYI
jgi:low affinity Fe/Cu permease